MAAWSTFKPLDKKHCLPYDETLTANNPFMAMSPYTLEWQNSYSNFVAMLANAVRREVADMYVYILPSLMESSVTQLSRQECADLQRWWGGFAEFLLAVLPTVAKILQLQRDDSAAHFSSATAMQRREMARELKRTVERLMVMSELPMKAMDRKVSALAEKCSHRGLVDVEDMWCCLSSFILLTLDDSYMLSRSMEKKSGKMMPRGLQERLVQGMLVPFRMGRAGDMGDRTANIVVSLCRWLPDAEAVRHSVRILCKRGFGKKMDAFCMRYVNRRCIDKFQFDRRPLGAPGIKKHMPSRVKFAASDNVQLF